MSSIHERDPWEELSQQIASIDFDVNTDVLDVTTLSNEELLYGLNETISHLTKLGPGNQALHPSTQEARDLHSLRTALLVELSRRERGGQFPGPSTP